MYPGGGQQALQSHGLAEVSTEASFAMSVRGICLVQEVAEGSGVDLLDGVCVERWSVAWLQV